jgi:hypothetical protein
MPGFAALPGGKQCTVNLPYVGNVKVPCAG